MSSLPDSSPSAQPALDGPPAFSSPHEEALINLMRTADILHHAMQQRLKPLGLTLTQFNVLRILRRSDANGLTCSAIGGRMITPEPDITRLLSRLKAQKLIRQHRDSHDRRVVRTQITSDGLSVLTNLDGIVGETPKELLRELTAEELRHLTRLLSKARNHADSPKTTGIQPLSVEPAAIAKLPSPHSARSSLPRHPPE